MSPLWHSVPVTLHVMTDVHGIFTQATHMRQGGVQFHSAMRTAIRTGRGTTVLSWNAAVPRAIMVGAAGFEPATSCSQGRRASQAALHPERRRGHVHGTLPPRFPRSHANPIMPRKSRSSLRTHTTVSASYRVPAVQSYARRPVSVTSWHAYPPRALPLVAGAPIDQTRDKDRHADAP
jgi:hypothetical protein